MKRLALAILVVGLSMYCRAQHSFPASDTANQWTGPNTFTNIFTLSSLANGCLFTTSGVVSSQACAALTLSSLYTNNQSTGTICNELVKQDSSGNAVVTFGGETSGVIGVASAGWGPVGTPLS